MAIKGITFDKSGNLIRKKQINKEEEEVMKQTLWEHTHDENDKSSTGVDEQ